VILVVSADEEIRETLCRVLCATGAATTREGLRLAPDARMVVLDLLSEGIDGQAFCGVLAPIVVVGVYEDVPIVIGPDRYMKTFTLARLQEAVVFVDTGRLDLVKAA